MDEKVILGDLITESIDHLQEIEPVLLELGRKKNDISSDKINQVFRAIHSIKGGFGFFGFKNITNLSHAMEHLLSKVREKKLSITNELIDAIFKGIDKLKLIFSDFENGEKINIDNELSALNNFTSDTSQVPDDSQSILPDSLPAIERLHQNLRLNLIADLVKSGKSLYRILLDSRKDIDNQNIPFQSLIDKWDKYGKIVDIALDLDQIKGIHGISNISLSYSVIYASVLEPDLIMAGLNISASQIRVINPDLFKYTETQDDNRVQYNAPASSLQSSQADDSLRVKVNILNTLMNLAGELVLSRNQLIQQFNRRICDLIDMDKLNSEFSSGLDLSMNRIKNSFINSGTVSEQLIVNETKLLKRCFGNSFMFQLKDISGAAATIQSIDTVTSHLQESIMQTRLQPVSVVFGKFPRVIRSIAQQLGKKIELIMTGQDVELDKSIIEALSDPLTHLIRNSADHGIEAPEEREKNGKDPTGSIYLSAMQEGGKVIIRIEDDGKGLDMDKIKKVAISRQIISEQMANSMTDKELQLLIMEAGFSTASKVSDISGRGVGMDVVKSNVERLGGSIDIESKQGEGTTISLTLPLTLAIIPSLIVSAENRTFAIPQAGVEELVRVRSFELTSKIERIQDAEIIRLRGKLLPLVRLSLLLNLEPTFIHPVTGEVKPDKRRRYSDRRGVPSAYVSEKETNNLTENDRRTASGDRRISTSNAVKIVVLKHGFNRYGLIVDTVFDNEEIVVKPLSEYFKTTQVFGGATILGDGKVAMILDPAGIALRADLRFSDIDKEQAEEHDRYNKKESEKLEDILLFDNGSKELLGMHLSNVARIESAKSSEIESVGKLEYIKRDGLNYSLVRINDYLPVSAPLEKDDQFFIILPKLASERKIGIIAYRIYDIASTVLKLDTKSIYGSCILGSAIINERITVILNIQQLISTVNDKYGLKT